MPPSRTMRASCPTLIRPARTEFGAPSSDGLLRPGRVWPRWKRRSGSVSTGILSRSWAGAPSGTRSVGCRQTPRRCVSHLPRRLQEPQGGEGEGRRGLAQQQDQVWPSCRGKSFRQGQAAERDLRRSRMGANLPKSVPLLGSPSFRHPPLRGWILASVSMVLLDFRPKVRWAAILELGGGVGLWRGQGCRRRIQSRRPIKGVGKGKGSRDHDGSMKSIRQPQTPASTWMEAAGAARLR